MGPTRWLDDSYQINVEYQLTAVLQNNSVKKKQKCQAKLELFVSFGVSLEAEQKLLFMKEKYFHLIELKDEIWNSSECMPLWLVLALIILNLSEELVGKPLQHWTGQ